MVENKPFTLEDIFRDPAPAYRPDSVLLSELLTDLERLPKRLQRLAELGVGGVIPLMTDGAEASFDDGLRLMSGVHARYAAILPLIREAGLEVTFLFEPAYERAYLSAQEALADDDDGAAKALLPVEYMCSPAETVQLLLRGDALMSVVALEEATGTVIDLRGHIDGRVLRWTAPDGNWKIVQYVCAGCVDENGEGELRVNPLSYDAAMDYLEQTYETFADLLEPLRGDGFRAIAYRDLAFWAPNHRNWDPAFNDVFLARFGFDPAPIYPALFTYIGEHTEHYKAMLLDCRAQMFADGMLRAYADFAARLGVKLRGQLAEPKLPACSALSGDALLNGRYAPGALLEKAYLYGANSVKLAAGAAYNYGQPEVSCEIYRDYPAYPADTIYCEACNAFSHGANAMLIHGARSNNTNPDDIMTARREFFSFISRTQALLQGGQHMADIAMLYPIYSLHAQVYFYQASSRGFEYPSTPTNADYMSLINSISIYAGHDLTLLHPETMRDKCRVENGVLHLDNGQTTEAFRVVILPSAMMVSLDNMRMLAEFFASGGKIIATGELPHYAFEFDASGENDREVQRLVREIFGADVLDGTVLRQFDYNENAAGGEAYHLTAGQTALDGTDMVPGALIDETIKSLGLPYDVLMPGMIHLECTGALSLPYPEFVRYGLDKFIPGKGMLSHIHKHRDDYDIFYFANTTDRTYNRPILLRGAEALEVWDPHTGEIAPLKISYVNYKNTVYTKTRLKLEPGRSIFFVSPRDTHPSRRAKIESIEELK